MNIGRRLNLAHGLMVVFVFVLILGANQIMKTIERDFASLAEQTLEVTRELENLRAAGLRIDISSAEYALVLGLETGGESGGREELERIDRAAELFQSAFERYSELVDQFFPDEIPYRDAIGNAGVALVAASRSLVDLGPKGVPNSKILEQHEVLETAEHAYLTAVSVALDHEEEEFEERGDKIRESITSASTFAWAGFAVLAVAILLFGGLVARGITRSLEKLTEATKRYGRGELTARAEANGNDEVGRLASTFNQMAGDLSANISALEKAKSDLTTLNEELRESEERVRLLLESTGEAIYGIDLDGNCTFCNPACLQILGYDDVANLLERNMHRAIHHTKPDGSPYPDAECQIYQAFRQRRGVHVDDEVLWRADGTSFQAEYW